MSFQSLRDALSRRLPAAPVLEEGDIQHAAERLLRQRLPRAAFAIRVTPRRIRISAASPAVRQLVLLLAPELERLLSEELQVPEREVQIIRW